MTIQIRKDPNKGSDKVWFRRGPQVLATDEHVPSSGSLPSGWWGGQVYEITGKRNGEPVRLRLVPFAEAGQNKQVYTTMIQSLEVDGGAK
jgi:hypothetical protein